MPTKHLLIKGKVQGVFYRASAAEIAGQLGVTGWIKNTEAGDVEAVVSGTGPRLAGFINWCRQGPPRAVVTSVDVADVDDKTFKTFRVLRGS